jgi:hypothetical protein
LSDDNFASLTARVLVRKGEAEPSPVMASSEAFPFAQRVVPGPVDAPIPARPPRQTKQRELPVLFTDVPAKPRRMVLQLAANEYEALALVAVKKGTTPQHLVHNALREFLAHAAPNTPQPGY